MKLLLALCYVSVAFAAIMSLNDAKDTSTYVQAVFLCATFALPMVLSHGTTSHARRRRKELEYQVRFIIHRYVLKVGNPPVVAVDNPAPENTAGVEIMPPHNDNV